MKKKKNNFQTPKPRQVIAMLCALAIPVLYVIAIVLLMTGNPHGRIFLAIAFASSFFLAPILYMVTKFPKDIAEVWTNLSERIKKENKK